MIQKLIITVILSLTIQFLGGYMAIASLGITTGEGILGNFGTLLFLGTPIVATYYLIKTYRVHKRGVTRGGKKALVAVIVGITIVIGVFPAILLGEILSEQWVSWRDQADMERLAKEAEEWKVQQRNTVCVTKDNVSYDFEFAGVYNNYETAAYALRDNAPQSVRNQAISIIDNRVEPTYIACTEKRMSPLAEREQLQTAFNDFIQLAAPYGKRDNK